MKKTKESLALSPTCEATTSESENFICGEVATHAIQLYAITGRHGSLCKRHAKQYSDVVPILELVAKFGYYFK